MPNSCLSFGKKNNKNNICDEKNRIAQKFSLFNLKNDNQYMIINDGHYNTNYKENNKLSINNIYLNGKTEKNYNKYIRKYSPINGDNENSNNNDDNNNKRQNTLINNFLCKTAKNNYDSLQNVNSKFYLDENRKIFNKINIPEHKKLKKFNVLSVVTKYI